MRRTPEIVSKKRQKIKQDIELWEKSIAEAARTLQLTASDRLKVAQQISYGQAQLIECRKRLNALRKKGKRKFWQKL